MNATQPRPRPCPVLRIHRKLGQVYVQFKVRGKRRVRYFGKIGSRAAAAKYAAWCRRWPWQLQLIHNPGTWPAVRLYTHEGRTLSLARWAREAGIGVSALRWRLDVAGWDFARAITTPKLAPHFARPGVAAALVRAAVEG